MKIVCVSSEKPDFASVDEAIRAALPLLMPFIRRAYQEMKAREMDPAQGSCPATPHTAPDHPRGKREQ